MAASAYGAVLVATCLVQATSGAQVLGLGLFGGSGGGWNLAAERSVASTFERMESDGRALTHFLWKEVAPADDDEAAPTKEAAVPEEAKAGLYFRPVSCTLYCVMVLTLEALAVYSSLAVARNACEMSGQPNGSTLTETLLLATRSAVYAPMLCLLFVACRMFVLATTKGLGEPPLWVKIAMVVACLGMTFQFLVILVLPLATQSPTQHGFRFSDLSGESADVHPSLWAHKYSSNGARSLIYAVQAFSVFCIYCGVLGVIACIMTFPETHTKMSAAVLCTVMLSALYFGIHLVAWILRTRAELSMPPDAGTRASKRAAIAASECMRKAPMFAVIFLAARMRALQLDPPYGMPPPWAQKCFYGVTAAMALECLATSFYALITKDEENQYENPTVSQSALFWSRRTLELATYAMVLPITYAMRDMGDADGNTHPLSLTTKAILQLGGLFFWVCLLQAVVSIIQRAAWQSWTKTRQTLEAASVAVSLCPQLSVLFLATRMRALQITQQQGEPPGYALQAMFVCVFATFVQLGSVLVMPLFTGSAAEVDEDGLPQYDLQPMVAAYTVSCVKYVALICLYGGVLAVCAAVFTMTPETARRNLAEVKEGRAFLKGIVSILFVVCVAMVLSSAKVVGLAIKFAIESVDRVLLGTDITVGKVALDICHGAVSVANVVVENPKAKSGHEWLSPYLLRIDRILFDLNTWKAIKSLGKDIEVQAIKLEGLDCCFELPKFGETSNVALVVEHLESLKGPKKAEEVEVVASPSASQGGAAASTRPAGKDKKEGEPGSPTAAPAGAATGPEVEVQEVSITDIGAGAYVAGMLVRFELDDIHFEDFSNKFMHRKGAVVADIVKVIVMTFLKTVLANKKIMGQAMKAAGKRMVQNFKDKFGGSDKVEEKVPDCPLLDK